MPDIIGTSFHRGGVFVLASRKGIPVSSVTLVTNHSPVTIDDDVTIDEDSGANTLAVLANDQDAGGDPLAITGVTQAGHGSVAISDDGTSLLYTPAPDYFGGDSFTYTVSAGRGGTSTATVNVLVTSINDDPTFATGADPIVSEDEGETGSHTIASWATALSPGAANEAGQGLAFLITGNDNPGLFAVAPVIDPNGTLSFTTAPDANGVATITVVLRDNGGTSHGGRDSSDPRTFTIAVTPVNDHPIANDDHAETNEDASVVIDVLTNDRPGPLTANDEVGQALTITMLNGLAPTVGVPVPTSHRAVTLNANGTVTYTPAVDYNGPDGFSYTVQDDGAPPQSDSASGYVTINPFNDAPILSSTTATVTAIDEDDRTNQGMSVAEFLSALTIADVDLAAVRGIAVTGVDLRSGHWEYSTDGGAGWSLLGNPTDSAALLLSDSISNRIRYVPDPDYKGQAGFAFRAWDRTTGADGGTADASVNGGTSAFSSASGTATITVNPVNDAPVASNDGPYQAGEDDLLVVSAASGVLANDSDVVHDLLTAKVVTPPSQGSLPLDPDGSFHFMAGASFQDLAEGEVRQVDFAYKATDSHQAESNLATVTLLVTGTNDAPTASPVSGTAVDDGAAVIGAFVGEDIDSDDDPTTLSYSILTQPAEGSVVDNNDGTFSFLPGPAFQDLADGETRAVSFTYRATDKHGVASAPATVTITVTGTNDAPVAVAIGGSVDEDGPAVRLAADYSDLDASDSHTFAVDTAGTKGRVTNNSDGTFSYDPDGRFESLAEGATATDSFTYTVTDNHGASSTATVLVTIIGRNDAPVAVADSASTTEDQFLDLVVVDNDTDVDSPAGALRVNPGDLTDVRGGTAMVLADGRTVRFTPDLNANDGNSAGGFGVSYKVNDGSLTSAAATVSIDVAAANDRPAATANTTSLSVAEDSAATVTLSGTDVETASPALVFTITQAPAHGTLKLATSDVALANGSTFLGSPADVTYQPDSYYNGPDVFAFKVTDTGDGAFGPLDSDFVTVAVTVTEVDDAPMGSADLLSDIAEDSGARAIAFGSLLANDSRGPANESGQTLTIIAVDQAVGSVVSIVGTDVIFTPAPDYNGPAGFRYTLRDDGTTGGVPSPLTATAIVTFGINEVNDAPTRSAGTVADLTVAEDSGTTTLGLTGLGYTPGPANEVGQALTYRVTSVPSPSLGQVVLADGAMVVSAGTAYTLSDIWGMRFRAVQDAYGTGTFAFDVTDDGKTAGLSDAKTLLQSITITITPVNDAPVVTAINGLSSTPTAVGTVAYSLTAAFSDADPTDTHTAVIDWGDGSTSAGGVSETNGSGTVGGQHTYSQAGVYTVTVTVTDPAGISGSLSYQYVVVYDPSAGFVTGGGWINSPAGAYVADPSLSGKANFGFNSQYKKGANVPNGNTEFQFKAGGLDFKSTNYEWLVVSGTSKAQFKGSGTIKGKDDYGFLLSIVDGDATGQGGPDTFRIKIWDKATGATVYDNQLGASDTADATTALTGGSVVIHSKLVAAGGQAAGGTNSAPLTPETLAPIVAEARARWSLAGVDPGRLDTLNTARVLVADLPDAELGLAGGGIIWIDQDAAGHGWYVDATPGDDSEFAPGVRGPARGRIDLLTAVMHEMGHLLGFGHDAGDDVMHEDLAAGVRLLPGSETIQPAITAPVSTIVADVHRQLVPARPLHRRSLVAELVVLGQHALHPAPVIIQRAGEHPDEGDVEVVLGRGAAYARRLPLVVLLAMPAEQHPIPG